MTTKISWFTIRNRKRTRMLLGKLLLANGVIDDLQLRQALDRQKQTRAFLGEVLLELNFVSAATLGPYLEQATGFPFVNLAECPIDIELARLIPEALSIQKRVLVFAKQHQTIKVAMADPLNVAVVDDLQTRLGCPILPYLAFTPDILGAISLVYKAITYVYNPSRTRRFDYSLLAGDDTALSTDAIQRTL